MSLLPALSVIYLRKLTASAVESNTRAVLQFPLILRVLSNVQEGFAHTCARSHQPKTLPNSRTLGKWSKKERKEEERDKEKFV